MNTFRKSIVAVVTTALISTSMVTTFNSADAGERMGRSHGNWGHHRGGGGMRGFGTGMAVGVGLAVIGAAIAANQHRETVARIRYDRVVRQAPKNPPVLVAKPKKECEWVAEWEKLLKSALATLETDRRMNAEYGEDVKDAAGNVIRTNHSSDHTRFQEAEVERIRKELEKAKEACKKALAAG
jgi:hypothetical protein